MLVVCTDCDSGVEKSEDPPYLGLTDCDSGVEKSEDPPTDSKPHSLVNSKADVTDWTIPASMTASLLPVTSATPSDSPKHIHITLTECSTTGSQSNPPNEAEQTNLRLNGFYEISLHLAQDTCTIQAACLNDRWTGMCEQQTDALFVIA